MFSEAPIISDIKSDKKLEAGLKLTKGELKKAWEKSFTEPTLLYFRPSDKAQQKIIPKVVQHYYQSAIVSQGDIFLNGYFYRNGVGRRSATSTTSKTLMDFQPWLKWDQEYRVYQLKTTGAQEQMIRSTQLGDHVDSIFFTPAVDKARIWAVAKLISVAVDRDELLRTSQNKEIYVGFES